MASDRLVELTASEAAAELATGSISAEDYARACLDRIAATDGEIKAFVHLDRAHVIAQAQALDQRRSERHTLGPLHGVPVAIKDIIDTADYPTELGSPKRTKELMSANPGIAPASLPNWRPPK